MDANGQRFWLVANPDHWRWRRATRWDRACRALTLASRRNLPEPSSPAAAHAAANGALETIPRTVDDYGSVARWDGEAGAVVARSHLPGDAVRLLLSETPTDLAAGHDGVLYIALSSGVRMHDLRGRWEDVTVTAPGFTPWRLAVDPAGGVWALDRVGRRLARLTGRPLKLGNPVGYSGTTFRPDPENCAPPTLRVVVEDIWNPGERPVALAMRPGGSEGGPVLLSWADSEGEARLWSPDPVTGGPGRPLVLQGARFAYGLAFAGPDTVLVRMPGRSDAPAFDLATADLATADSGNGDPDSADPAPSDGTRVVHPDGAVYPLPEEALDGSFAHRLAGPPRVPVPVDDETRGVRPLHPLSIRNLALRGEARHYTDDDAHLLDSGDPGTVWHRLYVEARIPAGSGFTVWCAATSGPRPPATSEAWSPAIFGEGSAPVHQAPRGVWEDRPSELPHHPGLGSWPREERVAGLWSVLIQDPRRRVRRIQGRYLWLRVELRGDGRDGPEIAALRAWGSRFSYRDQYLPRLYRETVHGAAAGAMGAGSDDGPGAEVALFGPPATAADFLERMLSNFEGVLTPLEDRIAAAHLLTDPVVAPPESLEWLASWLGVGFDPGFPADRRRAWLAAAPDLARYHATRRGLEGALDVASAGGVTQGRIVVVEDFRLRRLLATLLGVDLGVEEDPLLPGLVISGNSVVGDTLMLGDEESAELLGLFREDVASVSENEAVRSFHARLAHRATVLVHGETSAEELGLLERVVALESPAHTEVRVVTATWPLLVGIASLVAVDTWLGPRPRRQPARVQHSSASRDFVTGPAAVDPRLAGATPPIVSGPPVADAGEDFTANLGESFELDGRGSRAAEGRRLDRFVWRRLPPD